MSPRPLTLLVHTASLIARALRAVSVASPAVSSEPLQLGGLPAVWPDAGLLSRAVCSRRLSYRGHTAFRGSGPHSWGPCSVEQQRLQLRPVRVNPTSVDFRVASVCVSIRLWGLSCRRAEHRICISCLPVPRLPDRHSRVGGQPRWPCGPVAPCPDSCCSGGRVSRLSLLWPLSVMGSFPGSSHTVWISTSRAHGLRERLGTCSVPLLRVFFFKLKKLFIILERQRDRAWGGAERETSGRLPLGVDSEPGLDPTPREIKAWAEPGVGHPTDGAPRHPTAAVD